MHGIQSIEYTLMHKVHWIRYNAMKTIYRTWCIGKSMMHGIQCIEYNVLNIIRMIQYISLNMKNKIHRI